jgi:hypothetical protein
LLSKQPESDLRAFGNPLLFRFTSTENRSSTVLSPILATDF